MDEGGVFIVFFFLAAADVLFLSHLLLFDRYTGGCCRSGLAAVPVLADFATAFCLFVRSNRVSRSLVVFLCRR